QRAGPAGDTARAAHRAGLVPPGVTIAQDEVSALQAGRIAHVIVSLRAPQPRSERNQGLVEADLVVGGIIRGGAIALQSQVPLGAVASLLHLEDHLRGRVDDRDAGGLDLELLVIPIVVREEAVGDIGWAPVPAA